MADGPDPAIQALERFVGVWNTTGRIAAIDDKPGGELIATDTYEWLPGRHYLLHWVDARLNGQPSRSLEVVGFDADRGGCVSRSYDDQGQTGDYTCALTGDAWTITGDTLRFSGRFAPDGTSMSGTWQMKDRGDWRDWMDITLTRA